jgi:hypothetical protein
MMATRRVFHYLCPTGAHHGHDRAGPDRYSAETQRLRTEAEMRTHRGGKLRVLWVGRPKVLWWALGPYVGGLVTRHANRMLPTLWLGR